jgi:hypothetical protein
MVNDPMFSVNFANRIWKAMFNLGQVDTEDKLDPMRLDPNNPPAAPWTLQAFNPVLLSQLADTFVRSNYDLRGMLRFIANSSAYQLSSEYPGGTWDPSTAGLFARHYPRRMWGEEVLVAGDVGDADARYVGAREQYQQRQHLHELFPQGESRQCSASDGPNHFAIGRADERFVHEYQVPHVAVAEPAGGGEADDSGGAGAAIVSDVSQPAANHGGEYRGRGVFNRANYYRGEKCRAGRSGVVID